MGLHCPWDLFLYFVLLLGIRFQSEEAGFEVQLQLKEVFSLYFRDEQEKGPTVQINAETQRELFIGKINPTHSEYEKLLWLDRICFYFKDQLGILKVEIVGIFKFDRYFVYRRIRIEFGFACYAAVKISKQTSFYSIRIACIYYACWQILPATFCYILVNKLQFLRDFFLIYRSNFFKN